MKVSFRKDKKTNEILCFIPELPSQYEKLVCYTHTDGHCEVSMEYYYGTIKAENNEYEELLQEVQGIYYDVAIEIIHRIPHEYWIKRRNLI